MVTKVTKTCFSRQIQVKWVRKFRETKRINWNFPWLKNSDSVAIFRIWRIDAIECWLSKQVIEKWWCTQTKLRGRPHSCLDKNSPFKIWPNLKEKNCRRVSKFSVKSTLQNRIDAATYLELTESLELSDFRLLIQAHFENSSRNIVILVSVERSGFNWPPQPAWLEFHCTDKTVRFLKKSGPTGNQIYQISRKPKLMYRRDQCCFRNASWSFTLWFQRKQLATILWAAIRRLTFQRFVAREVDVLLHKSRSTFSGRTRNWWPRESGSPASRTNTKTSNVSSNTLIIRAVKRWNYRWIQDTQNER